MRRIVRKVLFVALPALAVWYGPIEAQAQVQARCAALSGFVTDASDGQPLAGPPPCCEVLSGERHEI